MKFTFNPADIELVPQPSVYATSEISKPKLFFLLQKRPINVF
jgi:hypothetical protein